MPFPGLLAIQHRNALPLTNLTLNFDPSQGGTVWQTVTSGNNPAWSVAGADGIAAEALSSIVPASPSDIGLMYPANSSQSPIYKTTAPALTLPCLLFDGINDGYQLKIRNGLVPLGPSAFCGASAKTFLVAFQIHAASQNNGTINPPLNHPIWQVHIVCGISVRRSSTGPDVYQIQFFNTANGATFEVIEFPILLNTNYVACLTHDGVNLKGSINGGPQSSIASGATNSFGGTFTAGINGGGNRFSNYSLGQALVFNAALSGSDLTAANTYMVNKWT